MKGNRGESAKSVLIVDDDEPLREALAELLTLEGYDVHTAANGREALDLLHAGPLPSVILVDLLMPVMDGWEFCEEQSRDPELRGIPVVVVSATSEPARPPASAIDGGVFRKPADLPRLLSTVERCCA